MDVFSGKEFKLSTKMDSRLEWKAAQSFCFMLGSSLSFVIKNPYSSVFVLYVFVLPSHVCHMYPMIKRTTTTINYRFRETYGKTKAVTDSAYLDALQLWLFPQLEKSEPNNFIWQQDGAPHHWHLSVCDWLNVTVPNQWIGRKEPPDKACIA
ncbi:UNVERIFIED_CONTAM: hypothetical protein NCL1_25477 [Trichonephila clavipes]